MKHIFGGLLIVLAFVGTIGTGTDASQMIAAGELEYSRISVCEWPIGHFLNYYITDHCGRELWFSGDRIPRDNSWSGDCIWAEGQYLINGSCEILAVHEASVCEPPPPPDID